MVRTRRRAAIRRGPAGYGRPGYPPMPPGSYEAPKRRRRWPWIVGGTILAIVLVLVVVGIVFGRKGSSDPHTGGALSFACGQASRAARHRVRPRMACAH